MEIFLLEKNIGNRCLRFSSKILFNWKNTK